MCDWHVGDRAICVDASPAKHVAGRRECKDHWLKGLRVGAMYHVKRIVPSRSGEYIGLHMMEGVAGLSTRFRKLLDHTPDADDEEVIKLLGGKPTRELV